MLQVLWSGKHRGFQKAMLWALAGGALLLFSVGSSISWGQGNGDRPDFRNIPGEVVLDMLSATDMRWLWFQRTGESLEPVSEAEQEYADNFCKAATRDAGGWAAGMRVDGRGPICFSQPNSYALEAFQEACAAFGRVFIRRDGNRFTCGQKDKSI